MDKIREHLEGTTRLLRIRRIKRLVLAVLFLLMILLSASALVAEGADLKPFYFPLNSVLPLILILLLIASVTNFAFRSLEMRHAKRDSQRYLIAKHSIQRAFLVLTVCVIVAGALALPFLQEAAQDQLRSVRTGSVMAGKTVTLNFTSRDAFAFSQVVSGEVRVRQQSLNVQLLWTSDGGSGSTNDTVQSPVAFFFPVLGSKRVEYRVQLRNLNARAVEYTLSLNGALVSELTTVVPGVLLAFAAANGIWIVYLRPVRAKHQEASIYGAGYGQEVERGAQTYADYSRKPTTVRVRDRGPATSEPIRVAAPVQRAPPRTPTGPEPEPAAVPIKDAAGLIGEGSQLFANGEMENALARFDSALELEPGNVAALLAASTILFRLQRREEAMGSLNRVLEIEPQNAQALAGVVEVLEADGRWGEAAAAWERYEAAVPDDPEARLRHADVLLKAKDRGAATRVLEEARRAFPEDGRIRVQLEEIHVDVPSLLSKALVASAGGRLDQAIALLDRILAQEPDNVNALVSRGIALRRADRKGEALASLEAALQRQPTNTAALRAKAQVLEEQGALDQALAVFDSLHEASPHDPEVFALQAAVFEKLEKNEQALAGYQQAMALDPNNEAYRTRAQALMSSRGSQEQFMEDLFTIKGMGPARVRAVLEAGYRTPESIRAASEEELAKISGLTKAVARELYRHFQEPPHPP